MLRVGMRKCAAWVGGGQCGDAGDAERGSVMRNAPRQPQAGADAGASLTHYVDLLLHDSRDHDSIQAVYFQVALSSRHRLNVLKWGNNPPVIRSRFEIPLSQLFVPIRWQSPENR